MRFKSTAAIAGTIALVAAGVVAGSPAAGGASTPPTVSVHSSAFGPILVNSKGFTLYMWVKDKPNKSACSGGCLAVWPLVTVSGKPTAGSGVNAKLLGTISVKVGGKTEQELTYNKYPLYTFVSDIKAGVISGQGNTTFGGAWWIMSPTGKPIMKKKP